MRRLGIEAASVTKKKSGPWPSHAVPLRKFLACVLSLMDQRERGPSGPARTAGPFFGRQKGHEGLVGLSC